VCRSLRDAVGSEKHAATARALYAEMQIPDPEADEQHH
jgi:hypothetical protein